MLPFLSIMLFQTVLFFSQLCSVNKTAHYASYDGHNSFILNRHLPPHLTLVTILCFCESSEGLEGSKSLEVDITRHNPSLYSESGTASIRLRGIKRGLAIINIHEYHALNDSYTDHSSSSVTNTELFQ